MGMSTAGRAGFAVKLLLLCAAVAGLAALGFWQISRGNQKRALIAEYQAALNQPPAELRADSPPLRSGEARPVEASGTTLGDRQLLLDGQAQGETPGVDVWTPLRLDSGGIVIVDRGWIPFAERNSPPAPPARMEVKGLLRSLPRSGFRLEGNCAPGPWPRVVEYPNRADLGCLLGETPIDGLLLLDPSAPDGFLRRWTPEAGGLPPAQHYGYAVTWFALAASLAALGLRLLFRTKTPDRQA